jgi:general transcription factor IIIA
MKLHEHRDVEATLAIGATQDSDGDESNATSRAPRKRRRGGDYGRDWKCEVDGCTKDFKSVGILCYS